MADDEADAPADDEATPKKKGGKGGLIGIVLAVVLGGAGFFASFSGMIPIPGSEEPTEEKPVQAMVAQQLAKFVPIDQLIISLGPSASSSHLKFSAQLEVEPEFAEEVTLVMPRILDVLNTYLRAVAESDIESPAAMTRLRAHMLRRIKIVTGEGRVKDLLITEFVLN